MFDTNFGTLNEAQFTGINPAVVQFTKFILHSYQKLLCKRCLPRSQGELQHYRYPTAFQ